MVDRRRGPAHADPALYEQAWSRYQYHYLAINGQHSTVYPGVVEGLQALRAQGLRLTLTQSDVFSIIVFWTVKGKPFYCLEPWTAGRNALNTGDRLIHLAPGASFETVFTLAIEAI